MNFNIDSIVTTANRAHYILESYLVKSNFSTSHQLSTALQPGSSTSEAVEMVISDRQMANNVSLEDHINELEWHSIVTTPHVRDGLRRLAAEARREAGMGEIEMGGFAIE